MSFTYITKLKLKTGSTVKCCTIRPSLLDLSSPSEYNFAEKYITSFGDNINAGLATGSTRTYLLDIDSSSSTNNNQLRFGTGPLVSVWKGPDPTQLEEYKGTKSFSVGGFFILPSGSETSSLFMSVNWSVDDLLAPEGAKWYIGYAYDDYAKIAWMYIINQNAEYMVDTVGEYTLRLTHTFDDAQYDKFKEWLSGAYDDSTDPYGEDPSPKPPSGGGGNFDPGSDPIDIPGLPSVGAIDSGFLTLYNPTIGQLHNLANYMWSDLFDIATLKKLFADPMNAIIGLSLVPVNVPSATSGEVTIGNIGTGVTMNYASSQYVQVDCGSINLSEYWGAYLDYAPHTKVEIYLPYCGTHPLSVDDVMNQTIHVVYNVDILTGALMCFVHAKGSVLYSFSGQCANLIPINSQNWSSAISAAISVAASVGTMVATGGMSAPVSGSQALGTGILGGASIASNVMNSKPSIEKSGSLSGGAGILGVQKPYLIITRPKQCLPRYQNKFEGYPLYETKVLSSCSGFTQVETIHLDNIPATDAEKKEIEQLLKEGVII